MRFQFVYIALCLMFANSSLAEDLESQPPQLPPNKMDILYLNETFTAAFIAFSKCSPDIKTSNDYTNMIGVYIAAAHEIEKQNPGIKPQDVTTILEKNKQKVTSTVEGQIVKRGCDAPDIKTLANNFKVLSNMSLKQLVP